MALAYRHIRKGIMGTLAILLACPTIAQVLISSTATVYSQNFNTLKTSKTSTSLPTGWSLWETGTSANTSYAADAGANTAGNTYSYGTGTGVDRAMGMLRSNSLISTFGLQCRNTTGSALTSLMITYTGEQWRCGSTGRMDKLDFQYSLNATALSNGNWTNVDSLDFISPYTTAVGSRDGNAIANRAQRSFKITGVSIPHNAIFWIRWVDFDAVGADDGIAIDDLALSVSSGDNIAPTVSILEPASNAINVPLSGNLRITFNEPVIKGSGSILLKKKSDASTVKSWLVSDATVSISNQVVTLTYTGLSYNNEYYIEMPSGVFKDLSNNPFAGFNGSAFWSFQTLPPPDTLKVVNWNIEWFGGSLGPSNDSLQEENVRNVMQKINADIYGLAEVVSASRLQNIVSKLPGYAMLVGDFCSNYTNCTNAQKLAFVYRTSVIQPVRAYAMLSKGGSDSAYYNWSSGRFPYLLEADVKMNGVTERVQFIMVHGKANTSDYIISYNRRKAGAKELRDSLAVQYPSSNWIVMGDYNDDLDKTITTQILPDTTTSFISFKSDPTFRLITLPLSLAGIPSTASYKDMIDHVTISDDMHRFYLPNSAGILKDQVISWVPNYSTTTSDHYPVISKYIIYSAAPLLNAMPALITKKENLPGEGVFHVLSHPGNLRIVPNSPHTPYQVLLFGFNGQLLVSRQGLSTLDLATSNLQTGIYILHIRTAGRVEARKVFIR